MDERVEEIRKLLPAAMLSDWVRLGSRLVRLLRDRRHAARHDAVVERLLAQARASVALREQRRLGVPTVSYPPELPITARKDEIVAALRSRQVIVVAGETGSGKTTQLPKMCLEAGLGIEAKIGCTQPRRVAALSISRRIAEELNVTWGREVGCKIRFDDRTSPESYIKLMTDGMLLAETQGDPLLCEYDAILIDEAHERSLNIDFLLGHLKGLLSKRPGLRLIIASATIDTDTFSRAFDGAQVFEVSGRLYPVEVVYDPLQGPGADEEDLGLGRTGAGSEPRGGCEPEENGELTYVDAAVLATGRALGMSGGGDVLIFMPTERDIRETCDQLEARWEDQVDIIPLFARLSSWEQQRVFEPGTRRKVVVATNIAETSLTIPGIRFVIDTGLARLSRYNPRTRTRRLPIEPVSQSSAMQRMGRCGRVREGVCIRLYGEGDFAERSRFTQPEIQRANLAEVILRLKAFRLGEIETFPFINPPSAASIEGGYALLEELGALTERRELTALGRDLARLPIDPALGRMLLQAQREHATHELLIIAAGLSIQDPRERPGERKEASDAAHRRFTDPASDFLTLLNLWKAVHEQWESIRTQNQRRKFCRTNFLSYVRMREWQDLHAQLDQALEELESVRLSDSTADYAAIHRSILAGLLGHVGQRSERNLYKTRGNRQLTVFPGSALFERGDKAAKSARSRERKVEEPKPARQPEWIMAGEIVETSQLFARTVAGIDPLWIVDLAPHLCKITHHNPHWSAAAGRVLVEEKITLYGLQVHERKAAYGNIDPKAATAIFIRSALVEEESAEEDARLPARYGFVAHNRGIRQKVETWQTRMRRHDLPDLDDALFEFYAKRVEAVSSLDELDKLLRSTADPGFLLAREEDLTGSLDLSYDAQAFPDSVALDGQPVPLTYAYTPGEEKDGVTLQLDSSLARTLSEAVAIWAVPGLRESQVNHLLRALPKALRRDLMPLPPKAAEIARELDPAGPSIEHDLSRFIQRRYGVHIAVSAWAVESMPPHLRPRLEIVGHDRKTVMAGRDLNQLREHLERIKVRPTGDDPAWAKVARQWERFGLTTWSFGDLPERLTVREDAEMPIHGWPGLVLEEGHVNLRVFHGKAEARRASLGGVRRLVELAIQKDLGWLEKDLRGLASLEPICQSLCTPANLQVAALANLKRYVLPAHDLAPMTEQGFRARVQQARERLPGLGAQMIARLEPILRLRLEVLKRCNPSPSRPVAQLRTLSDLKQLGCSPAPPTKPCAIAEQLWALVPNAFLERIDFERLVEIPRYLKALLMRADRAGQNPVKDRSRALLVQPYETILRQLETIRVDSEVARQRIQEFRWMIEEFKVSVFAQEVGTAYPISTKRLDEHLKAVQEAGLG